jgi:hypothetical protein
VEGYQLQGTPEGFLYTTQGGAGGASLPGRDPVDQGTWLGDIKMDEPRSFITVTRYAGASDRSEAEALREVRAERLRGSRYTLLGPLRDLPLQGGGQAWSWTEERHDEYERFRSLQVTAVATFDSVSFVLEFDTSVPERMTEGHLDAVLATFALGRTAVHWNLIYAAAAAAALLLALLWRRGRRREPAGYRLWERAHDPTSTATPKTPSSPESQDPS